ncbi:ADP-ribosylglycohydrolase family protein [Kitasatospora aburaviensis]
MTEPKYPDRVRGALLGGAVGDALGWPVEFQQLHQIRGQYGRAGVTGLPSGGRIAEVTDDTQMTLFTAEGLIRGFVRGWSGGGGSVPEAVHGAYRRWLLTQNQGAPDRHPLPARTTAGCCGSRSCTRGGRRATPA